MRAVGLALALLLVPAAAQAEGGRPWVGPKKTAAQGHVVRAPGRAPRIPRPQAPTTFKIVPPRAATVLVNDDDALLGQVSAPSSIVVPTGKSYGITAMRGGRVLWSARIAAAGGSIDIVWHRGPAPIIQQSPPPQPVSPPLPLGPSPMAGHSFKQLIAVLSAQDFESGKMDVVKAAAASNYFTASQVGRILDELAFDSDKLKSLEMLRGRILDPENGYSLARHFDFQSSQQKAMAMFSP